MAGLSGLNALAKSINKAKGGEDLPKMFGEEFELLLKSAKEQMAIKEDDKRWQFEKGTPYAFHPSNMGACPRCIFYNYMKYEPEPGTTDATLKDIQDYGTDRHERVQKALVEMPSAFKYIDVKEMLPDLHSRGIHTYIADIPENQGTFGEDFLEYRFFNPDVPLWFKTDGVFEFRGLRGVFEFKTEISFKFNKRGSPEPSHIDQANLYASSLGLDWIFFRYEIRGDLFAFKNYLIPVDKAKVAAIHEKARYILLHADNNELPPKEENKSICDKCYCKHHEKCSRDYISDEAYERYLETKDHLVNRALDSTYQLPWEEPIENAQPQTTGEVETK